MGTLYSRDLGRLEANQADTSRTLVERIRLSEYHRAQNEERKLTINEILKNIHDWMEHQRDETDARYELTSEHLISIRERLATLEERARLGEPATFKELRK